MQNIFVLGVSSIFGDNPSIKTAMLSDNTLMLSADDGSDYAVLTLDIVAMTDLRDTLSKAIAEVNGKTSIVEQAAAAVRTITWDLPEPS